MGIRTITWMGDSPVYQDEATGRYLDLMPDGSYRYNDTLQPYSVAKPWIGDGSILGGQVLLDLAKQSGLSGENSAYLNRAATDASVANLLTNAGNTASRVDDALAWMYSQDPVGTAASIGQQLVRSGGGVDAGMFNTDNYYNAMFGVDQAHAAGNNTLELARQASQQYGVGSPEAAANWQATMSPEAQAARAEAARAKEGGFLGDLGPLAQLAAFIPSPIQPIAQAVNAANSLDQGNILGAALPYVAPYVAEQVGGLLGSSANTGYVDTLGGMTDATGTALPGWSEMAQTFPVSNPYEGITSTPLPEVIAPTPTPPSIDFGSGSVNDLVNQSVSTGGGYVDPYSQGSITGMDQVPVYDSVTNVPTFTPSPLPQIEPPPVYVAEPPFNQNLLGVTPGEGFTPAPDLGYTPSASVDNLTKLGATATENAAAVSPQFDLRGFLTNTFGMDASTAQNIEAGMAKLGTGITNDPFRAAQIAMAAGGLLQGKINDSKQEEETYTPTPIDQSIVNKYGKVPALSPVQYQPLSYQGFQTSGMPQGLLQQRLNKMRGLL